MAYQASVTNTNFPLILSGEGLVKENETLLTIGGRSTNMVTGTLMAKYTTGANAGKWAPWLNANLGATDGTQTPAGILVADTLLAATIAAGDVTNLAILVGGSVCQVDSSLLTIDGGTATLSSVPTVPTNACRTAEQLLNMIGIFPTSTIVGDQLEN